MLTQNKPKPLNTKMKRTSPFPSPPLSPSQNKKEKFSSIQLMNKQLVNLSYEDNETLSDLVKNHQTEFEGLTLVNLVNSRKFYNFFESTTDESEWKSFALNTTKVQFPVFLINKNGDTINKDDVRVSVTGPQKVTGAFLPGDTSPSPLFSFKTQTTGSYTVSLYDKNNNDLQYSPITVNVTDTLCKDIKGIVPVYFIKFHDWFLTISRKMPVCKLKHKLKKFLKVMVHAAAEIRHEEDCEEYDKGMDFSNTPITDFPFKLQHLETNHILEIWNDDFTLEEAKIQDHYAVLFDGDRLSATSPNLRIYFNSYQKIVFPRTSTWEQFHKDIKPFVGSDRYVVVKISLGGYWNPIVKNLDQDKPLFPQIEPRDHLFVTKTHNITDASHKGNHLLFLKTPTDKKTLLQLSVNPQLPLSQLMKELNQTPPATISPSKIYWENYDHEGTIDPNTFKCGEIPERTILCFPDPEPKLRVLVYTPPLEFQELEFTPGFPPKVFDLPTTRLPTRYHDSWETVLWGDLKKYYYSFLKTKHNFIPPKYSDLVYRFSDRRQNSWTSAESEKTLLYLSDCTRSNTLFVSLKVPFYIQQTRNTSFHPLTINFEMHDSIGSAIRFGTHNRYQVHRLCLKEDDKYTLIEKHMPVLSFLKKTLVPFSYIQVNGKKLLFPHFTSIQKTLASFEINSNTFNIVNVYGDQVEWNTQTDGELFPEDWIDVPNDEIERSYQKALKYGKFYNPPFSIERVSQREFNLKFGLMAFRISLRSSYSKKFQKVFQCKHDETQKRLCSKLFISGKQNANIDLCTLATIIYNAHNAKVKESLKDQRCSEMAKNFKSDVDSLIGQFSLVISNDANDIKLGIRYRLLKTRYQEMPRLAQIRSEKNLNRLKLFYENRCLRQKYIQECRQRGSARPWEFELHKDENFACVVFCHGVVVDSDSFIVQSEDGHSIDFTFMDEDPDVVSFGFNTLPGFSSEAKVVKVNNGYSIAYTLSCCVKPQTIRSTHVFTNEADAIKIARLYEFHFTKMISNETYVHTCYYQNQ